MSDWRSKKSSGKDAYLAKMKSATQPILQGRLSKQMKRMLPCYAILIFFIFVVSRIGSSDSDKSNHNKRAVSAAYQSSPALKFSEQFPRKIWQMWKVDPLGFEERDLVRAKSWTSKNPGHRYEVLTDSNDMYWVESTFGPEGFDEPNIVRVYRELTARIIKADILRYLVMWVEGGTYADIDVEALKPIDRFIPDRYNEADVNMVISVEIDQPQFKDHSILGQKSQSFCQWTFMCKPRQPVMMRLINHIINWLDRIAEKQGVPISDIVLDFDDVLVGTGPSAFTEAVLAEMSVAAGKEVTWDTFHLMQESKLVGGFLVLTVEAFAAGQGHSDSGNHNSRGALVKHHYHASGWPTNHPRYNHPVYGEVERCNWNPDCVAAWDAHKAEFDALPAEEQVKQIWDKLAQQSEEQVGPPVGAPLDSFPVANPPQGAAIPVGGGDQLPLVPMDPGLKDAGLGPGYQP